MLRQFTRFANGIITMRKGNNMGFIKNKIAAMNQEYEQRKMAEKQRLLTLTEKELLVEIALSLKEINAKCDDIRRRQAIYGN